MFSGSIFVVLLVVFVSQAQGQNSTTVSPSATSSSVVSQSSIITTPNGPPTTKPTTGTSEKPTASSEKTCFEVSFILCNLSWHEDYRVKSSDRYKKLAEDISSVLKKLFGMHENVEVSDITFKNTEGNCSVLVEAKVCLVFDKKEKDLIKVVFFEEVKKGKLGENLTVVKDSAEFEASEVEYKNYKAKEGECDKCDGAAGPFDIEGECVPKTGFSCNGLEKTKTKETKDCTEYCSSTALTVSTLVLAIGILLSSSFQ